MLLYLVESVPCVYTVLGMLHVMLVVDFVDIISLPGDFAHCGAVG